MYFREDPEMPAKRRQRGRGRGKREHPRKDASSEDMDSQDQLTCITDKLARKRLVKSSTDTEVEQQEHKENITRQRGGDGYDADFETSEFDTASADSDMDCQTQSSRADASRAILSPTHGRNRTCKTQDLQKKAVLRHSRRAPVQPASKSSLPSHSQHQHGKQRSKRKTCSMDSAAQPLVPSLKSPENMMMFTLPNGSDSSTPLSNAADSKSEVDSLFGFEGLVSPPQELPFSPVLPESPTHIVASADSKTTSLAPSRRHRDISPPPSPSLSLSPSPSLSLDLVLRLSPSPQPSVRSSTQSSMETTAHASHAGQKRGASYGSHKRRLDIDWIKDENQGPPKKPVKKKKTQKRKEEDAWTMKMSAEFDDIEMFELTVE